MDKNNPLLPFAFMTSSLDEKTALNTTPRHRKVIDENAGSMYHTRVTPDSKRRRPTLKAMPTLKRKMGESFNEKDDIKRRETTEKEEEEEEATFVDDDNDTPRGPIDGENDCFKGHGSLYDSYGNGNGNSQSRSHKFVSTLPSSPTLEPHMHSEYDTGAFDYTVPDSPIQTFSSELSHHDEDFAKHHKPPTLQKKRASIHRMSSEADFGIDPFNRFKSINQCPSTDRDFESDEHDSHQSQAYERARQIVIDAFEDMNTTINLESLELKDIPEEVKDFDNLVIFGTENTQHAYQLYLTNNKLKVLPPSLFSFTKLNVLGLRQNKISRIPALIENLQNLVDLSLGTNRLEYLPPQMLHLPRLQIFRAGPNPYIKVSEDAVPVTTETLNPYRNKKFVSPIRWKGDSTKLVPSLKTLCLDKIANYDVTYQETKNWKKNTPTIFHSLIATAISRGQYKEKCNQCHRIVVEPIAEAFEWWDLLQNKDVPIKFEFCSGMCAKQWHRSCHIEENDLDLDKPSVS